LELAFAHSEYFELVSFLEVSGLSFGLKASQGGLPVFFF
jgi:hypothetical protein